MLPLIDHLSTSNHTESRCDWTRHDVTYGGNVSADTLAKTVASVIVQVRCPDVIYRRWLNACAGTRQLTTTEKRELEVYIKPSIGLRGDPAPDNQIQAVVAEHLWYEIIRYTDGGNGLPINVMPPSLRVTEPGGDGLVVYEAGRSTYFFRLWEIKKHATSTSATTKITKASKQLNDRGEEYLAKWSKVGQDADHQHTNLSKFYAQLVGMWLEADGKANAGVSISKDSLSQITATPITVMRGQMPTFIAKKQLEGMIISIPDFANLANKVREELWKGI